MQSAEGVTNNSPVRRHLNQLSIERSAEGRDDGDERQETPSAVLARQACLEPKHLEGETGSEEVRENKREIKHLYIKQFTRLNTGGEKTQRQIMLLLWIRFATTTGFTVVQP